MTQKKNTTGGTHIVVLLDKSGSMATIVDDVIGGFNTFLAEQQENGNDARMSMVLFDSQDPQDTVVWGAPVTETVPLDRNTFVPRGGTPLLDATGLTIGRTMVDQQARVAAGLPKDDIIFVTITDGGENESREFTLERIRTLVNERTAEGWQFVYLSAGLDAYQDAGRMGYSAGSTQSWRSDGANSKLMFDSLSRNTRNLRDKKRRGERTNTAEFFEDGKDAEDGM